MKTDAHTDVVSEVARRLDDLFSDGSESKTQPQYDDDPPAEVTSPLAELNAIMLAIDWEITGENMQGCIDETERLKGLFTGDPAVFKLLQILGSVARYVNSRKAASHPDAINLLHSVFSALTASLAFGEGYQAEKTQLLAKEAAVFKALKAKIQINREKVSAGFPESAERGSASPSPAASLPPSAAQSETDALLLAIADLKQLIQAEFATLRRQISGGSGKA